jgi:hypothetical protein
MFSSSRVFIGTIGEAGNSNGVGDMARLNSPGMIIPTLLYSTLLYSTCHLISFASLSASSYVMSCHVMLCHIMMLCMSIHI